MFARFDENPAMTLRVIIKETKRTHGRTDGRTNGQRENSIPPTNKVCGGYKYEWHINMQNPVHDIKSSYSSCENLHVFIERIILSVFS